MARSIPEITVASENERSKVLHTILMGFSTDPFVRWICPDALSYSKFIGAFDAFGGGAIENSSAYVCGNFQGAALWLPPAQESDEERFIQEVEANVLPERHETLFRILDEMEGYHPHGDCWYLPLIAVDPVYQNQGIGSQLMKYALNKVDSDALPAYLESSNPKNISLYERYGFEIMGRIQIADAPPIHPMIRERVVQP